MTMQSKVFSKFFITSAGIAAPPEMQARSEDMSADSASSTCSIPAYIVGTPSKTVTLSRPTTSSALAASKRGMRVRQAPLATAALSPQVRPKQWNSGRQPMTTSSSDSSTRVSAVVRALVIMLSWVSSAPLGWPVVPEV